MKVVVFDNAGLGLSPALTDVGWAWRHAADVGTVGFTVSLDEILPDLWVHAGDSFWGKGDQLWNAPFFGGVQVVSTLWVILPGSEFVHVGPHFTYVVAGFRYQWIFVGTNGSNARVVTLKQALDI